MMDLFINDGSIVLIPFFLDKCDEEHFQSIVTSLSTKISNIVAKVSFAFKEMVISCGELAKYCH
jgi:hypothetical protein